jgi:hypothetical protein
MTFANKTRFNRSVFALPLLALLALSAGCGDDNNGTSSGSSGGSGGAGGAGGTSATGGAGGSGGSGASGGTSGTGGAAGGDAGGGSGIYGTFIISILDEPPPAYTKLLGQIYDGPQPPLQVLKLDSEEQGCQLMVPKNPFCAGGCTGGVCVDENNCQAYPGTVNAGTANISGFKGGDLVITPTDRGNVYQPNPTLPAHACDEGNEITVKTDKFTLKGKCVSSLELTAKMTDKIPVKTGMPVKLTWTPPGQANISRMEIHLDIAHHGGKKGEINCDVADTGSFDIPATLVSKLVSLGLAGFPTIEMRRVHTSPASNEPNVKILLTSDVARDVDTGVVSCNDSSQCPPGQTCDRDLTCK